MARAVVRWGGLERRPRHHEFKVLVRPRSPKQWGGKTPIYNQRRSNGSVAPYQPVERHGPLCVQRHRLDRPQTLEHRSDLVGGPTMREPHNAI